VSRVVGLIATVAAVLGSVWLAHRSDKTTVLRRLELAGNTALAATGLVLLVHLAAANSENVYLPVDEQAVSDGLLRVNGRVITNIYPFDDRGRALRGIYLVDQDGNPINLVGKYDDRVTLIPTDQHGNRVANRYPAEQRVVDPITGQEHPPPVPTFVPPQRLTPAPVCPPTEGLPPEKLELLPPHCRP
jgi:hypothetical protein